MHAGGEHDVAYKTAIFGTALLIAGRGDRPIGGAGADLFEATAAPTAPDSSSDFTDTIPARICRSMEGR